MTRSVVKVTWRPKIVDGTPDELRPGQWYWVHEEDKDDRDLDGRQGYRLMCITHLGTNYARLEDRRGWSNRIHYDEFDKTCTFEANPDEHIQVMTTYHQQRVAALLGQIQQLTARLGLTPAGVLPEGAAVTEEATQALVVAHGTEDIKKHKAELIRAKEKTLPDLFKKVEEQNEQVTLWMKATLIPMLAEHEKLKKSIDSINDRIFTVELYAGLVEQLVQVRKGKPAPNDTPVHLMQRRHYMDEECLVNYQAGGMEFANIGAFDRWIKKKENATRIMPHPRCVVAFRVRRKDKEREWDPGSGLRGFIDIILKEDSDKTTFLYIRNGSQIWRMTTQIDFGAQLFPDTERSILLGSTDNLYFRQHFGVEIISEGEYLQRKAEHEREQREFDKKRAVWDAATEEERKNLIWPGHGPWGFSPGEWKKVSKGSVYYDDVMQKISEEVKAHNRIAVVLQGLLDRSPAFQPHPPWRLWTEEGFSSALRLVYDDSKALTTGEPPDFEAYRAKLNASIAKGSMTVGQQDAWERHEAKKENDRQHRDWRCRHVHEYTRYTPYGNPGPGLIAEVERHTRTGKSVFAWERDRLNPGWVDNPDDPDSQGGKYYVRDKSKLRCTFTVSDSKLLNVSAYQPGDFKQFYNDPRTRADYIKWAPLLLAAEDWHGRKK